MRDVQVAVVGAGPAGLSAALAAARAGARTALFDEHVRLGGQLRYRITELALPGYDLPVRPFALATELVGDAFAAGVDVHAGALAWGLFRDNTLGVIEDDASYQVRAERIILATGSTDLPFPFAGGSLSGVLTARGAQILMNEHRVLPGTRFVVLGGGPEASEVAADIRLAGGEVVAIFDPKGDGNAVEAAGERGIASVALQGRAHAADVAVLALGRQPDAALALMAECAADYAADFGGWVPVRDDCLQTTIPGIYAAGDDAGTCDVAVALAEGKLAGLCAAASLKPIDEALLREARAAYEAIAGARIAAARRLRPIYVQGG